MTYMTYRTYHITIDIHPTAMGHVIGKRGTTIERIRRECNVVTRNTPYTGHQKIPVKMRIEGYTRDAVQEAIFQIDHQVAISNTWCKNNGVEYHF
jgi:predicted RNA-binding protein YlqC (UPF0109 family)